VGRFSNELRTRNRGVDLGASGQVASPLGAVNLKLDATYQSDWRVWSPVRNGWGDNLAGRSGYPRWKLSHSVGLNWGAFTHTLGGTTTSGTPLRGDFYDSTYTAEGCAANGYTESECRVAGYTRWDYGLEYRPSKAVKLHAQVYNVFNLRAPIAVASWLNGGGILPPSSEDPKGRMLGVGVEVGW
jgi:iron complex outermembrane receptor protein